MGRVLVFICAALLLAGQNPPAPPKDPPQDQDATFRETFKFVVAPVTVTDKSGNFVNGLTPYDFRLFDNGKLQKITQDAASHPISLVVAIQANSQMEKILPQIQKLGSVFEALVLGENGE